MLNHRQIKYIHDDCIAAIPNPAPFSALKNQSILVTGATGFMGSWLLESLALLNDVHAMNIRIYALSRSVSRFKTERPHLGNRKDITFIDRSVTDIVDIPSDVTWVIHAGATPDNRVHVSDPIRVIQDIVQGTRQTLDACTRLPQLKKFLLVSSGLIYGASSSSTGIPETHVGGPSTESALSAYAEAKRMAETLTFSFKGLYRLPISIARPFAFIGPYQLLDRPWAINNFIRDALAGTEIRILGNENTIRSYMYPSDMCAWLLRILVDGKDGGTYNVGSPDGRTLRDVAQIVAARAPRPVAIATSPNGGQKQLSRFVPDITKGKTELALDLRISVEEAIRKTMEWHSLSL